MPKPRRGANLAPVRPFPLPFLSPFNLLYALFLGTGGLASARALVGEHVGLDPRHDEERALVPLGQTEVL